MGRIISAAAWRVGIFGLVALQVACTATIERRKSPDIDARIIGSDSRSLTVEGKNGRSVRVPGTDVVDIDHPGNVLIVVGAVFGALALAAAESSNPGDRAGADGAAIVGLGLMLGGAIPYFRSVGAAGAFDPASVNSSDDDDDEPPRSRKKSKRRE